MVIHNAHHPSDIDGEINQQASSKRLLEGEVSLGNY
jgi:hypothetical protein